MNQKVKLLGYGILFAFLVVLFFLFRWQVLDHDRYVLMASDRFQRKEIPALRGDILAQDGTVLSYSVPKFNIYVYKDEDHGLLAAENSGRQTREEFMEKVSMTLEIEREELQERFDAEGKWVMIAEGVDRETRDLVMSIPTDKDPSLSLDGLNSENTSQRVYPENELAAHVLGFVGQNDFGEEIGGSGLEQYFDGLLKPQVGIVNNEVDSGQNVIALSDGLIQEARRGASIKTTINKNIQRKVENILQKNVEKHDAVSGSVVIIDPLTGEIISMANYPQYNPNHYEQVEETRHLGNISITNPYEIGSVGKIYTMAAAVDQGKVKPNTVVIDGHQGCQKIIEGKVICTYDKKSQGALTATEAMKLSDNLALFATAELVGPTKLATYLEEFGIGTPTEIQLAGEDYGYLKPGEKWNQADLATISYGHGYFQTAIQAATGVAALANGGKVMEPLIVDEIIEQDQTIRQFEPKVVSEPLSEESTKVMAKILHEVYLSNLDEHKYQHLDQYYIGMKSGTALIPYTALHEPQDIPGYSSEVNATYIGYDASPKASFLMLVNISEPKTSPKLSYYNARPLWLDIFDEIKDDLGVPKFGD